MLIAPERDDFPPDAPVTPAGAPDPVSDPFAPGHESRTPPELARVDGTDGGWGARAFESPHPALTPDALDPPREASLDLFSRRGARSESSCSET